MALDEDLAALNERLNTLYTWHRNLAEKFENFKEWAERFVLGDESVSNFGDMVERREGYVTCPTKIMEEQKEKIAQLQEQIKNLEDRNRELVMLAEKVLR
jgi:sulfur transfer protein SufE